MMERIKEAKWFNILKKFPWVSVFEVLLILVAGVWVGKAYLDLDPNEFIKGGEFTFTTLSHYAWNLLNKCGPCVFWNGYKNGGAPSFVEIHGAFLHPLVILTSLWLGVVNGSKIVVIASLCMMGLGTWWLTNELNLGFGPRIWASLMTVVGGEIFGRLHAGNVPLVLSIASSSFILPAFLHLQKKPNRRRMAILAVFLALLWLSGQGYSQLIVMIAYIPILLVYLIKKTKSRLEIWPRVIQAGLLSLLLASILLVPFIHFMGNWQKPISRELTSLQPLEYSVLNLVIRDRFFYDIETLDKNPLAWSNINYIGWIPVILLIVSVIFLKRSQRKREMLMLYAVMALAFIFSSQTPYLLFKDSTFVQQLRFISVGASLAIQPLILIAAISIQELIELPWAKVLFPQAKEGFFKEFTPFKYIVILAVMLFSIKQPYEFGKFYLLTQTVQVDDKALALLDTDSSQWVSGVNYDWLPFLVNKDQKVITADRAWSWKGREEVKPLLSVIDNRSGKDTTGTIKTLDVFNLIQDPNQIYAFITDGKIMGPCSARSLGGQIDVTCDATQPGTLIVREYYFSGWHAWMDGTPIQLETMQDFLTVPASSGHHMYSFRYQPWDVWVGMGMSLIGIIFAGYLLIKKSK